MKSIRIWNGPQFAAMALLMGLIFSMSSSSLVGQELTLDRAIELSIENDDWLRMSADIENSQRELSISAGELPDPTVMISLANLPTDSFDFNQEPMTQFRIGVNQSVPRGDTLDLLRRQFNQRGEVNPYLREDRIAQLTLQVSGLWFDAYLAEQSISLINDDRTLFEQLVDITSARYTSTAGLARQDDLVRAQVELVRLDDRLARLRQLRERSRERLAEWLPYTSLSQSLPAELPDLEPPENRFKTLADASEFFVDHPRIKAHDKQIEIADTQVEIERQSFKPAYRFGAGYGYRDDTSFGINRSDFISLDVSFELPLFTARRQAPRLRASQYRASATRTERLLLVKNLFATYQQAIAQLDIVDERAAIYNDSLLSQLSNLTEATLASYTADEGDFEEVMRAYISELNAKIELLEIDVERLKVLSQLQYLLTTSVK